MNDLSPIDMAKASLKYFTVEFLDLKWPGHYDEWRDRMEESDRSLFEAPRGSWKTWFFSLAYPLWRILRGPTEVLLTSDSEDQARKNLRVMRQKIESSPKLSFMQPTTKEIWGTDQISFSNNSIVTIMGFGTSKRGLHPDVIVNDDIESENNRMSREDKDRMYFGAISGMATMRTKIATVGTPMEFGDLLEQLSKNPAYTYWRRPALKDGVNQYPDIWTDEWLEFRRKEMGTLNFAREMLLERIDPATQPFKQAYETLYDAPPENYARTVTVCDPAYTEGDGDYTAIVTVKFTHGNHAYITEAKRFRREDPGVIVDELFKSIQSQAPDAVGIPKKKGEAVSYSFEERRTRENRWDFKYVKLPETVSKSHKNRIGGLVPRWEARTIHVHRQMKDLLTEIYQFRLDDSHKHDDMLDALAHCFNEEMVWPNSGKRFVPMAESARGHAYYGVNMTPPAKKATDPWMLKLDKRHGDKVAA